MVGQPWGRSFGFEGGNRPLCFSPDGATVYYGKTNGDVEKVDIASGTVSRLTRDLHNHNGRSPRVLAVTSDVAALFVTNWVNRIVRIDTSTGQVEDFARINFHQGLQPGPGCTSMGMG